MIDLLLPPLTLCFWSMRDSWSKGGWAERDGSGGQTWLPDNSYFNIKLTAFICFWCDHFPTSQWTSPPRLHAMRIRGDAVNHGGFGFSLFFWIFSSLSGDQRKKKSSMLSVKAPSPCPGLCCPFLTPLSLNKFSPFLYTATFPGETLTESGAKLQGRHGAQFGQWLNSDVITKEPCKPRAGKRGVD